MSALCFCDAPATAGALCTAHLSRLRADLLRAPAVLADLDITITGQDHQGGSGNGDTPDKFNEAASDARTDLMYLLVSAAQTGDPAPRGTTLTPAQAAVRAVNGLDTIARSPGAHTLAQDLHDALVGAEQCTDIREERIVYGPCSCGGQLIAPASRDTVRCRECGALWPVAEYRAFQHAQVLDHLEGKVGTLKQVCEWLKWAGHDVPLSTAQKWTLRPRDPLEPVRTVEGIRFYRYAEVRAYALERRARTVTHQVLTALP